MKKSSLALGLFLMTVFAAGCGNGALGDYWAVEMPADANGSPLPGVVDDVMSGADTDGDGFIARNDCNDDNAAINPGVAEVSDGIDNDCDSFVDEISFDVIGKDAKDLNDAITAAADGAIIQLTGALKVTAMIVVSKPVKLVGSVAVPVQIEGGGIEIDSDSVTLKGLNVSNAAGPLVVMNNAHKDIAIENSSIHGATAAECVKLENCTNCDLTQVNVFNCAGDGVVIGDSGNVVVKESSVAGSNGANAAMYVYRSSGVKLQSNLIHQNATDHGIKLDKNSGSLLVAGNEIANNTFTSRNAGLAFRSAIFLYKNLTDEAIEVVHNLIEGNDGRAFYVAKSATFDPAVSLTGNVVGNQTLDIVATSGTPSCRFETNIFSNNNSASLDVCADVSGNYFK